MKKLLPLVILFLVVAVFFRQFFLQNLLPIPADTIVGLYHPFRDMYAKDYPRGIPFKNFLITDPVRQQYPWRFESIFQEKKLLLPLWNPYNFAGAPLLANQQSAALYPLNLIFFVLPFPFAWGILIFAQPVLAGIFLFLFLRNLKIDPLASFMGGFAFAFSGFFISWLEWGTVDHVALWTPLLFLTIDKLIEGKSRRKWLLLFIISVISSFFAGHLQTFFYVCILTCGYFGIGVLTAHNVSKKLFIQLFIAIACIILLTAVQWIPLLQLIQHSARNVDLNMQEGWFLPWQNLIMFLAPDFFGNPTTLNYWGIWNYAEFVGYIGIPGLLFACYALFGRKSWRVWYFAIAAIVALLFALPTFMAYFPFQLHIPFISTAQPTRLLFVVDFSLAALCAIGLDSFIKQGKKVLLSVGIIAFFFLLLWAAALFSAKIHLPISSENVQVAKRNLIFPTIIFLCTVVALALAHMLRKYKKIFFLLIIGVIFIAIVDLFRFADKFTPFTSSQYLFPTTKTISFLSSHVGNYRFMTTDSQILPPNFSLIYHLQSVEGYDPLYITEYGELIAAMERNKPDIHAPFGFNRIITPHNIGSHLADLLGVKYVLSLSDVKLPKLRLVFSEGDLKVYENMSVLPRAFFVKKISRVTTDQAAIDFLFKTQSLQDFGVAKGIPVTALFASAGRVTIDTYRDNTVVLKTKNDFDGFLVFTDVYYPTWSAYIDGKKVRIYPTDMSFRGIFVPKGSHTIIFANQLF